MVDALGKLKNRANILRAYTNLMSKTVNIRSRKLKRMLLFFGKLAADYSNNWRPPNHKLLIFNIYTPHLVHLKQY